ncbi:MAG: DNA internalization-related competence protein ComEC/Rec2, partial [Candidatus Hydrogenedentes bacterium]|nr:DNA internalization-related competence protein ComEC/Rec2 [Candidatus Hydrogenedentota bacterium]
AGLVAAVLPGLMSARLGSVGLLVLAAGALMWHARHAGPGGDAISRLVDVDGVPRDCAIEGVVRLQHLENDNPDELTCVVDAGVVELGGKRLAAAGSVRLRCNKPAWTVHAGERVRARGKISARFGYPNFGVPSIEAYWAREGVFTSLAVERGRGRAALERLAPARWWSGAYWMSRLRKAEADRLEQALPPGPLPFIKAIWLGYRASMARDEYQDYVKAGVAHILSVSGIHASILFVTVGFFLRLLVKNRRWWALITMLAVLVFALTTGLRPSALRAAVMIAVVLAAQVAGREPDSPSALGLSALVLLAWNPDTLFDTGFQLSFLSLASILLFTPVVDSYWPRHKRVRRRSRRLPGDPWLPAVVRKPLSVSIAVQILPMPVVSSSFHIFPAAGVLVNLAVIPLSAVMLWLTFVTLLVSLVSMQSASLFGHAVLPLYWTTALMVKLVASSDWTWLRITSPTPPALLAFWGMAGCVLAAGVTRRPAWLKPALVLGVAAVATWRLYMPEARVDFLCVRNGDAIVVTSPGGRLMLIDGGDADETSSNGEECVAPFLWAHHVRRLDYVVVTHSDRDHLGGLFYIVENFGVGEVWLAQTADRTPLEVRFEGLCAERGVPVRRVSAGDAMQLGAMAVRVLHPPSGWTDGRSANESSVVLSVEYEGARVLLTGDVEEAGERLVAWADCRAGVMKAPHHGSGTSSGVEFLDAVSASDCVVTCAGPASSRVSFETLNRYTANGCRVWRTDVLGGIRVNLEKNPPRIESVRRPPGEKRSDGSDGSDG